MSHADEKTERYAGGTIRQGTPTKTGIPQFFATTYVSGERRRALFRNRESARAWLDVQSESVPRLTRFNMIDAAQAVALLPPQITLLDAVKFYVEYHKPVPTIPLKDGFAAWLESRQKSLRPETLKGYARISSVMQTRLGENTPVSTLTTKQLDAALINDTPSVRNASIRVLSAFLTWATHMGYINNNPASNVRMIQISRVKRNVLTLPQAESVLTICQNDFPSAVPYFAIGMFAGVRPFETLRLRPADFANGYIRIGSSIAKTATGERTIPIRPNLAQWLSAFPVSASGVYPSNTPKAIESVKRRIFKRAGIENSKDILRHSFASYLYDLTHDAARVASELGHTDTTMLFKHYRGLVPPGDGERYFSIFPT